MKIKIPPFREQRCMVVYDIHVLILFMNGLNEKASLKCVYELFVDIYLFVT